MKYLFINSVAGIGSTGKLAAEKCRELMAQGHRCLLAYGREKANCEDIPTVCIGTPLDYKLHGIRTRLLDQHGFGSKKATKAFLEEVRRFDPDVVWLHNIHGYYIHIGLLFDYLKSSGKKVIWTLHDCWSFTGHCAHFAFAGCQKWQTGCSGCPQKGEYPASMLRDGSKSNYAAKRALFTGLKDLTLITPSKWLADLVKQSFLGEYPVEVVYNTINTEVFKPTHGNFRERYGLTDKKVLLGVAGVWTQRKGLDDFLRLAQLLDPQWQIVLVGLTQEQIDALPKNILGITRTNSALELAQIYTAADVFFNPTYEDNYPTVNLEAQACGTRVITYDTGGCRETISTGDSKVIPAGDLQAFVRLLEEG